MKVYVMSPDKWAELSAGRDSKTWPTCFLSIDDVEAAMTPIDIPDGCQLAVVDTNHGIGFQEEADYCRVVQVVEVK